MTSLSIEERRNDKRRSSDNGGLSSMPWWVRAVAMVGVPSAALLFILYYVIPQIGTMPRVENKIDTHIAVTTEAAREAHEHGVRMEAWLRQMCVSLAKSEQGQQNCLMVR